MGVSAELEFAVGQERACHNVTILDDDDCEPTPENFFADLTTVSGDLVAISRDVTEVFIDDTDEDDCG